MQRSATIKTTATVCLLGAAAGLNGCSSHQPASPSTVHQGLVLADHSVHQDAAEYARNDALLAPTGIVPRPDISEVEIIHDERLRTINDRPWNYTSTRIRSYQRRDGR